MEVELILFFNSTLFPAYTKIDREKIESVRTVRSPISKILLA